MIMTPCLRKFALTAHVVSSVGWLGVGALVFLSLSIIGLTGQDAQTVRAANLVMEPAAWYVLVPRRSLRCSLGLFKHWAPRGACSGITGSCSNC